jgi:hypothetical protein
MCPNQLIDPLIVELECVRPLIQKLIRPETVLESSVTLAGSGKWPLKDYL